MFCAALLYITLFFDILHNRNVLTLFTFLPLTLFQTQVRLYDVLFKSEAPETLGDEWLGDINPDSLQIVKGAFIPPHLAQTAKVGVDFERRERGFARGCQKFSSVCNV